MEMTNKHNNSSERILRETDHETQIHNVSRVLTNDQINHTNTKHKSNHAHLLEKDNIKRYKHTSFRGNMNAEVTVKHLIISTHLIYTDSQNPPPFYEAGTRKSSLSFDKGSHKH